MATNETWKRRLSAAIKKANGSVRPRRDFATANADSVRAAVAGRSIFSGRVDPDAGARAVVNISSAHVPSFCKAARDNEPRPYKNYYDLGRHVVGDGSPKLTKRERVDQCLPIPRGKYKEASFAAAELNGCGIPYYGDICLVLTSVPPKTRFLDRNSFEFFLPPLLSADPRKRMREHSGNWEEDLPTVAAIKVLDYGLPTGRRVTTARISEALRSDEDYIEILKQGSFGTADLTEVRTEANQAALESHITDRLGSGPMPSVENLLWLTRRQVASRELAAAGCAVRVVTISGRSRT